MDTRRLYEGSFVTLLTSETLLSYYDGGVGVVVSTTPYFTPPEEVYGVRLINPQRLMHVFGRHLRPATPVEILAAKLK